jgi:hypothetical protein
VARIKQLAEEHGIAAGVLGETIAERMEISLDAKVIVSAVVSELAAGYEGALESALQADPDLVVVE